MLTGEHTNRGGQKFELTDRRWCIQLKCVEVYVPEGPWKLCVLENAAARWFSLKKCASPFSAACRGLATAPLSSRRKVKVVRVRKKKKKKKRNWQRQKGKDRQKGEQLGAARLRLRRNSLPTVLTSGTFLACTYESLLLAKNPLPEACTWARRLCRARRGVGSSEKCARLASSLGRATYEGDRRAAARRQLAGIIRALARGKCLAVWPEERKSLTFRGRDEDDLTTDCSAATTQACRRSQRKERGATCVRAEMNNGRTPEPVRPAVCVPRAAWCAVRRCRRRSVFSLSLPLSLALSLSSFAQLDLILR